MSIFVIAEIGINHNGSLAIARRLIDVAKDCGADAVKFQKRTVDLVYDQGVPGQLRATRPGARRNARRRKASS